MGINLDPIPTDNPKSGFKWKAMGICFTLIGFLVIGWGGARNLGTLYMFLIAVPLLATGHWLYRRGLRLESIKAETLMQQDDRAPVLYLRSFRSDGSSAPDTAGILNSWRGGEEEQIAKAMNEIGPFVAIGKPNEKLPELGAARTYQKNEDWHEWVKSMMTRSQLVIFRAGATEGFWWEVSQAALLVKPERMAFLLPFGPKQYEKFRTRAEQILPCRLPDHPEKKKSIWTRRLGGEIETNNLQAILYFDRNWIPHIEPIKIPFYLKKVTPAGGSWIPMYAYIAPPPVTLLVKKALSPVLTSLGLNWRQSPQSRVGSALLLTLVSVLILIVIVWASDSFR